MRVVLACGLALLASCAALDEVVTFTDPDTGEQTTTTVGDALADSLTDAGEAGSTVVGKVVGGATGNPVLGLGAAALLSTLVGTGAAKLRRRKGGTELGSEA